MTVVEELRQTYHTVGFNVVYLVGTNDLQVRNFVFHAAIVQVVQTTDLLWICGNYELYTDITCKYNDHSSLGSSTQLTGCKLAAHQNCIYAKIEFFCSFVKNTNKIKEKIDMHLPPK